jgi:phenylacetate-coenzyme A ligase PaaK-like adenylate-forming protein
MDIQRALTLIDHHNESEFRKIALSLFKYQLANNQVYKSFCKTLKIQPENVQAIEQIPFLPVSFFRSHQIAHDVGEKTIMFESSGTTKSETSRHYVSFPDLYEQSFSQSFRLFYGEPSDYVFLSLLPSYLERQNSSLVYMMNKLMKQSGHPDNGFFLKNDDTLYEKLRMLKQSTKQIMLFGVSFALLDFAERYHVEFPELIIVETGGMKGRRQEITRKELHEILMTAFQVNSVHSEYGMTELLSQAWSSGKGLFRSPPWMKILIREMNDPLTISGFNKTGGVNVIDFANAFSCPFIATDDLGILYEDGGFEILGRFDSASVRGCNTMLNDQNLPE